MTVANPVTLPLAGYAAQHVKLAVADFVATITLNRPEHKNPLTFESYAELGNIFRAAARDKTVKAIVVTGAGGNFSSGGDVFEIIKPLTEMETTALLDFTRMTGELVKAMRAAPQPIIAAIDGVCAGAGAIMAMASDIRIGTPGAKVAFLFNRVSLAAATWEPARSCRASSVRGGRGTAFHRARAWWRGSRALGLFQSTFHARPSAFSRPDAGARTGRRPDLRQFHDQADAGNGMGDVGRNRDRSGSGGAGFVHGNRGFRPRLPGIRGQAQAGL